MKTMEGGDNGVIEHKAYARVGFLGNPSDVYFGKTIAFSISNFFATVKLRPSKDLIIQPHPTHDLVNFSSIHQLVDRLNTEGYYGGVRLLMAIYKVFYNYCKDNHIHLHHTNFTLSYDTNIPRQVYTYIVCKSQSCVAAFKTAYH
jgi:glucuronokinase